MRQIAPVTMESSIYWSYGWSQFRTVLKTALQNCRYFSMKRVCFLWKQACWKTLQLETHQFIRGTKFPAPAGPCGRQSFGTLCPHPPLCGTMEKQLANGTYTLHAHTSLVSSPCILYSLHFPFSLFKTLSEESSCNWAVAKQRLVWFFIKKEN